MNTHSELKERSLIEIQKDYELGNISDELYQAIICFSNSTPVDLASNLVNMLVESSNTQRIKETPDPDNTINDDSDSDPDDNYSPEAEIEAAIQSVKEHVLEKSRDYDSTEDEFEDDSDEEIEDSDYDANGELIPYYARPRVNFMNLVCDRMNDNNRQRRQLSDKGIALIDEWFLVQGADASDELKTAFNDKLTESFKDPGFMYADNQPVKNWGLTDETSYDWITKDILGSIVDEVLENYLDKPTEFPHEVCMVDIDEKFTKDVDWCPCDVIETLCVDKIMKLPLYDLSWVRGKDISPLIIKVHNQVYERHQLLLKNGLLRDAQQHAREARRLLRRNEDD